jgi:hypothetical protein
MLRLNRVKSRLFREVYVAELRSFDTLDGRHSGEIMESVERNLIETLHGSSEFYHRMDKMGRPDRDNTVIVVVNQIHLGDRAIPTSAKMCDHSCEYHSSMKEEDHTMKKKPLTIRDCSVTATEELLLLT